ncbi:MAG: MBL fold metallo-hydrolase [Pseudomonadota bacterium]
MTPNRRQILAAGAAAPFAGLATSAARAGGHAAAPQNAIQHTIPLGDFRVSTLLSGTATRDDPKSIFGLNASPEEFAAESEAAFLPTDKAQFFFTPTVVNTGSEVVLFDTGLNPGGITQALAAAGYTPDQIDVVAITHMHGDHIGGLSADGVATFPNARYVTGEIEFDHWAGSNDDGFEGKVRPLSERFTFLGDGGSVASGITAVSSFGHTPGHMGYMIESSGSQLLLVGDAAAHAIWSIKNPDWHLRFDTDKDAAVTARRKLLGMAAADKIPLIGYHLPFPAIGFVAERGDGFEYVPASYQFMMG